MSEPAGPWRDRPRVLAVVVASLVVLALAVPLSAEPPDRDTIRQAYAAARKAHDPSWSRVVEGTVLERAHPLFDEPTLGVVVDGALHYVANSQYRHFDADGTPDLEQLQEPAVLRLELPWLSGP